MKIKHSGLSSWNLISTSLDFFITSLAFVASLSGIRADGVSNSMKDSWPNRPRARLCHLRVGEESLTNTCGLEGPEMNNKRDVRYIFTEIQTNLRRLIYH